MQVYVLSKSRAAFDACQQQKKKTVHAEIQLLLHICRHDYPGSAVFNYIGCSKRNCFLCWNLLRSYGKFPTRGSHGKLYNGWMIPETDVFSNQDLVKLKKCVSKMEETLVSALLREALSTAIPHAKESTIGSSSLASMAYHYIDDPFSAVLIGQHLERDRSTGAKRTVNSKLNQSSQQASADQSATPLCGNSATAHWDLSLEPVRTTNLSSGGASSEDNGDECGVCDRKTKRHCSLCGRDWYCSESWQKKRHTSHRFLCAGGSLRTADYLYKTLLQDEVPDDPQTTEQFGFD